MKQPKYVLIFSGIDSNALMTDLMIHGPYGRFPAVFLVDEGLWQLYLPSEFLHQLSEEGYMNALQKDFVVGFNKDAQKMIQEIRNFYQSYDKANSLSRENFIDYFNAMTDLVVRFFELYTITEFFYSGKIDQEIYQWAKQTHPAHISLTVNKLLNGTYQGDVSSVIKQLANFLQEIGRIRFELRETINQLYIGDGVYLATMRSFARLTNRDDFSELTIQEIRDVIFGKDVPDGKHRRKLLAVQQEGGEWRFMSNDRAHQILSSVQRSIGSLEELHGHTASPGKAQGIARIYSLSRSPDFDRFNQGNILVASTTGPEFMPAIQRAGAIVTNEGGLMSHAAVVAREFDIPCVIGTEIGNLVIKEGDLVEVDADRAIVKILKRANG